jgi:hypothetical protein
MRKLVEGLETSTGGLPTLQQLSVMSVNGEPDLLEQLVRNMYKTKKFLKSAVYPGVQGSDKVKGAVIEAGSAIEVIPGSETSKNKPKPFIGKFKLVPGIHASLYDKATKSFPMYVKMYDPFNNKMRLYKRTSSTDKDSTFTVLQPLGEGQNFFELYPNDLNTPKSISPNNGTFDFYVRVTNSKNDKVTLDTEMGEPDSTPTDSKPDEATINKLDNPLTTVLQKQKDVNDSITTTSISVDSVLQETPRVRKSIHPTDAIKDEIRDAASSEAKKGNINGHC